MFQSMALFLRQGLPSTLIRHENGTFRKRSSNRRNLKAPGLRFSEEGKHFESGPFQKRRQRQDKNVISLPEFSTKQKCKMTGDCCVFKFLRWSVDGA